MLAGEPRGRMDRIRNAFWSGGIANPLEGKKPVMQGSQEENCAPTATAAGTRQIPPKGRTPWCLVGRIGRMPGLRWG